MSSQNTAFPRSLEHDAPTKSQSLPELSRIVSAILHLAIPCVTYLIMYHALGTDFLSMFTSVVPLSPERRQLYLALNIFYALRWAFGMLTMRGHVSMSVGIQVAVIHLLVHELPYIVFSMGFHGVPSYTLTLRDYVAAGLMVVAGFLQHGSEAQRWVYKLDPKNQGKIHTTGLFGLARGINHTGHMLRDFASCIFAPNPLLFILYLFADYHLAFSTFPSTIEHMKKKYGVAYENYEARTPYLFIPGVY